MKESADGISGYLEYTLARFTAAAIGRLTEHLLVLLQSIVRDPRETAGKLPMIATSVIVSRSAASLTGSS